MVRSVLVSVHISSIFPASHANHAPIDTVRSDVPLPESDPDVLVEHASFSSTFSSIRTGTILLRIIHDGLVLEVTPLTSGKPTRFVFPARILQSPAILLDQLSELRIFVVTTTGSLFTLTFPVDDGIPLFSGAGSPQRLWCHEYSITMPASEFKGPVHVKDLNVLFIGLTRGRFLRLDSGSDYGVWRESLHRINSSWKSYLVFESEESQIVSFASHPPPTDSILLFSLSRDRTLRAWNHGTCVASYTIKHASRTSLSPAPREETPAYDAKAKTPLLGPEPCTLIRVIPASDDDAHVDENLRVLVFLPTPGSFESGGRFHLFRIAAGRTTSKDIYHLRSMSCSPRTAGAELRDFILCGPYLYALWDQKGRPLVEFTHFDPDVQDDIESGQHWQAATYPSEIELTPDYLDDLLLQSGGGSLADILMTALLRPGVFSHFTIETALHQYVDTLLSIPGPQPAPFQQSYLTLSEHISAVVGCTVNITVDPRTGVPQRVNYWNALKRDWEGFVARCREVERIGRWPLSLGVDEKGSSVLILERERIGILAPVDLPLDALDGLKADEGKGDYPILEVGSSVLRKLTSVEIHAREAHFESMVSQERGYSYAETLAHCLATFGNSRPDVSDYALSRLEGVDFTAEFERVLDLITSLQSEVKTEDPEEDEGAPEVPHATQWARGVATSYVLATIETRYELCLALVVLLFHLGDLSQSLPPALLTRLFAIFRNVLIARFLAWQPAGDPDGTRTMTPKDQDGGILRGIQNMTVTSHHATSAAGEFSPTYSLIHRIMQESGSRQAPLPEAAFSHLQLLGFFESRDVAEVTTCEAALCKWLVDLGFRDVALEVIGRLPRSPAISYVHGLLLIELGRVGDGALLLQRVGANFGPAASLSDEDDRALRFVTQGVSSSSEHGYYKWVATLLERNEYCHEAVRFYKLAIELAIPEEDTSDLWRKVVTGYTELGMFEEAYTALVGAPYESIKREAVSQLVQAMCEANAVDRLMALNFVGLPDEVETALAFKLRNADPLSRPLYPQVLYAWYVFKGDFRNAAATMYLYARRLSSHAGTGKRYVAVSQMQANAYLVAMNALSLIDSKSAWISMPATNDDVPQNRKRRKLSKNIPEDKYQLGSRDAEMVDLADMRHEYTLVSARLELIKRKPELLAASQHVLSEAQIVSAFAQAGSYEYAMNVARSLGVDMTEVFERLTVQCMRLMRRGEAVLQDETTEWLHSERAAAWPGTPAERGWRFLRVALEQHDTEAHVYRKAAAVKILEGGGALPSWLVGFLEGEEAEWLIQTSVRFGLVEEAVEYCIGLVKKADATGGPRRAGLTWVPYGLIDGVVAAAEAGAEGTSGRDGAVGRRLAALRAEVGARAVRMAKWSTSE